MKTNGDTNIVNNGFVTGNGFTGGIVGNLFTTGANTSTQSLTGLRNNGTVSAGANYKGDTEGDARSLVLGQFFGGIAGYGRGVTLQGCESVTRSDLTETQLKEQVMAGFKNGALTDASPLKGDFVGGLVGYGKEIVLNGCKTVWSRPLERTRPTSAASSASMMPAGAAVKTRKPQPPCRTAPTVCLATTPPTPAASTC